MQEFLETKERLLERLGVDPQTGLSPQAVEDSRRTYGVNALTRPKPLSLFKRILAAMSEPMLLLLIAAGLIAVTVNIIRAATGGHAEFWECVGIFGAIALSVAITVIMEGRSAKAFEALEAVGDNAVIKALRGGESMLLGQKEIVVGDVLLLSMGDKIPADGRLLESRELTVDESALTGESVPSKKDASAEYADEKTPLAERSNMVYAGNYVTGGFCKVLVTAVGDATEFGKIAQALTKVTSTATPLQEKLGRLGKLVTIFGVTAAAVVFAAQLITFAVQGGLNFAQAMEAFITSIVLIVAAVPEGLPTIVAVTLSISIIKLSRQNALVKKMIASETVGCINVLCSDKTGTLTENKMAVRGFYDGVWKTDCKNLHSAYLIHNVCLNTTADLGADGGFIGNPTECAVLKWYEGSDARIGSGKSYRDERADHTIARVFPFTSELKHMTTVSNVDGQIVTYVKGSPECVTAMCDLTDSAAAEIEETIRAAQQKAMRVIAFAHKVLDQSFDFKSDANHDALESHMTFDGFVAIADPLRADVYDAVAECRRAGIDLKILTGDNLVTATAIALELKVLDEGKKAVEAREIADLDDSTLSERLKDIAVIARSTPSLKMRVVELLKAQGNVVAVTGDGINDAPALKNADVGIAMGISGTEVSKEAGDVVLLDDSFSTIVKAVRWGRGIFENFKRFIQFQLTVNVSSVIVVLTSILMGMPAPFTALQLLWINIIMDGPPALTLGLEPTYGDLMRRKPTDRNANILSKPLLLRILLTGAYVSVLFLTQYACNYLGAAPEETTTVLFALFSMSILFNAFNCRELGAASIFVHLFKNKWMLIVCGITFVLQIVLIQFAGAMFGTVPLSVVMWLKILALSLSVIAVSELVKLGVRLMRKVGKSRE